MRPFLLFSPHRLMAARSSYFQLLSIPGDRSPDNTAPAKGGRGSTLQSCLCQYVKDRIPDAARDTDNMGMVEGGGLNPDAGL